MGGMGRYCPSWRGRRQMVSNFPSCRRCRGVLRERACSRWSVLGQKQERFVNTPNRKLKGVACQAFRGLANTNECPGCPLSSFVQGPRPCARQPRQLMLAWSPDWPMVAWIGACATQRASGGSQDFQHRICRGRGDDSCDSRFAPGPSGWNCNAVGCKVLCQLK